jgi:hypothetical protein
MSSGGLPGAGATSSVVPSEARKLPTSGRVRRKCRASSSQPGPRAVGAASCAGTGRSRTRTSVSAAAFPSGSAPGNGSSAATLKPQIRYWNIARSLSAVGTGDRIYVK